MVRKFKHWLVILLPVLILTGVAFWFLSGVHASYGYSVEAEFSALPADDVRFEQWLSAQPGVVPHTVHIERTGTKNTIVRVHFIQSRNLLGIPPLPALDQACSEFGYGQPVVEFRDSTYH